MGVISNEPTLDFCDVLIQPRYRLENLVSRSQVDLNVEILKGDMMWRGVPIVASNMSVIGTFKVAEVLSSHNMLTALHKFYALEDYQTTEFDPEFIMPSSGISSKDISILETILNYCPSIKWICLDVANGYISSFVNTVKYVREKYPDKFIVAGNVVTPSGCRAIVDAGADFVKIGIGSSRVCKTRVVTGVGYPQFSAVLNCSQWYNVMSDGGCVYSGDVAKAFGAGASMVMIGSMLANHDETGNRLFGMSSKEAMTKHYDGGYKSYRAPEGREVVFAESKGPLDIGIKNILGGLRSALTYTGYDSLEEAIGKMDFIRVNRTHDNSLEEENEN